MPGKVLYLFFSFPLFFKVFTIREINGDFLFWAVLYVSLQIHNGL